MLKLFARSAVAIGCTAVALGVDVVVNVVASGKFPWQASIGIIVGAAAVGAAADAFRQHFAAARQRMAPTKLAPWPDDEGLVERRNEKDQLVRALTDKRRRANVVIVEGPGGCGKSTLARLVCTDPEVSTRFSGVYRIDCGEEAVGDLAIAGLVNGLIEIITGDRPVHTDPRTAGQHLGQELSQHKRILLFIDNAWTERQVAPFLVGARRCTRLVTTRLSALPLSSATRVSIGPLSADESRDLLLLGLLTAQRMTFSGLGFLDRVIARTWHWPLILRLLNGALRVRVRDGYSPDVAPRGNPRAHHGERSGRGRRPARWCRPAGTFGTGGELTGRRAGVAEHARCQGPLPQ